MSRLKTGLRVVGTNPIEHLKAIIASHAEDLSEQSDKALKEIAETLLEDSKPYVPEDTKTLVTNGEVVKEGFCQYSVRYSATVLERAKAEVALNRRSEESLKRIKNPNFNYAFIQHENIYYKHKKGTHHYLLFALEDNLSKYEDILERHLRSTGSSIGKKVRKRNILKAKKLKRNR